MITQIKQRILNALWHVTQLRSINHHTWLYRTLLGGRVAIPRLRFEFTKPAAMTAQDVSLCSRLIGYYGRVSKLDGGASEGTWPTIFSRHHRSLIEHLEAGDPERLARLLAGMFQEEFMYGITSGSLIAKARHGYLSSKIRSLKCLDSLVSLAEYLGVTRAENPEQGVIAHVFEEPLELLVDKIEEAVGFSINFPRIGAPYGLIVRDSLVTLESPEHIYVARRVQETIERFLPAAGRATLVELGAGFGGTAFWLLKLRRSQIKRYVIIDLPLSNILQGYFLSRAIGDDLVGFYGEISDRPAAPLLWIQPTYSISDKDLSSVDVLINENSMPEMPEAAAIEYISWARQAVQGCFYSYNHEGFVQMRHGALLCVPDIVAGVGGFRRVSRSYSWVRRGYVEEIYVPSPPSGVQAGSPAQP